MSTFVIKLNKDRVIKHTEVVSEICTLWLGLLTLYHFDIVNIFSTFSATASEWINLTLFLTSLLIDVKFIYVACNYLQIDLKADKELKSSFCFSLKIRAYICLSIYV